MGHFVHEKAICDSNRIGDGTNIWAFAHVLPGAIIGNNCNICDGVLIENDVIIGNDCTIQCGVQLGEGVHLEDRVVVGPNVTFTNDLYPRSRIEPSTLSKTVIRSGVSIGANATILPGIELGENCLIGAGALVNVSVPPNAVVEGNPCRIVRFAETEILTDLSSRDWQGKPSIQLVNEMDIRLYRFASFTDHRGTLTVVDHDSTLPFAPRRMFTIQDVPEGLFRGNHAHKQCHQLLICLKGSCSVHLDDGKSRMSVLLDSNTLGLHIPPRTWGVQYHFSSDAVLQVLASAPYDTKDYISCYAEFLAYAQQAREPSQSHPSR